ncbi:MAG: hypothetical protein COT74_00835 [Bdellovibrionales bacterium CG10_big_fil_rev_8_21_14_0_10_45_34]|nr:MAG: hypothetical protein COT74_00835 [Bdellovibrionales bacterium CG10_big_fil_rev_8_21_14_0_10_45_34]
MGIPGQDVKLQRVVGKQMKFFVMLFLLSVNLSAQTYQPEEPVCEVLFEIPRPFTDEQMLLAQKQYESVYRKYATNLIFRESPSYSQKNSSILEGLVEFFGEKEQRLGRIKFEVLVQKDELSILDIRSVLRGRHLGTAFFAYVLINFPQVRTISTFLAETNAEKFFTVWNSRKNGTALENLGRLYMDSIKNTPAYKARAELGFDIIEPYRDNEIGAPQLSLRVTRRAP